MRSFDAPLAAAASPAAPGVIRPMLRLAPGMLTTASVSMLVAPTQSLPVAHTQSGSMFKDRFVDALTWYLPSFQLTDDVDEAFAFTATQTGVDVSGNPFNQVTLAFGMKKVLPADVATYAQQNPSAQLREIPLSGLQATLTTTAQDPQSGQLQTSTFAGTVAPASDGSLHLAFNTLLGVNAIVAYEDLQHGGAMLVLSASYDVWRELPAAHPLPVAPTPIAVEAPPSAAFRPGGAAVARSRFVRPMPYPLGLPSTEPAPTDYVQGVAPFAASLVLAAKYAGVGYTTKYTVNDGTATRVIASVNDLKNFNTRQSEFSEFTALGDISQKYPSFDRLYIGALSRTVVALPARYGILRSATGTAATCRALLDPSGASGACKFQFAFVIAPVVSQIELLALTQDIAINPASHDCRVTLPTRLDSTQPATPLATPFLTTATYAHGDQAQTFSFTVEIEDNAQAAPAVASANLFIKQLSASAEPYLAGRVRIKLDDAYEYPVEAGMVLNFNVTGGGNEIGYAISPDGSSVVLTNISPLDLNVTGYAVVADDRVSPHAFQKELPSGQSVTLPTNGITTITQLLVDRTLALESPLTKVSLGRYLAFQVQDVQAVQYGLGVVASAVDFVKAGIAKLDVRIAFMDLPDIAVPTFSLTDLNRSGNVTIALPIQYAISTLVATVAFSAQLVIQQPPIQWTMRNDFIDRPVLVLQDTDIPGPAPPVG